MPRDSAEHLKQFVEKYHQEISYIRALFIAGTVISLAIPLIGCGPDMNPKNLMAPTPIVQPISPAEVPKVAYWIGEPTPVSRPKETQAPSFRIGSLFAFKDNKGNLVLAATQNYQANKVTYVDDYHNTKTTTNEVTNRVSEIAPGLTVEAVDEAIDHYITFDKSIPADRQLQGKALIARFLTKFSGDLPKNPNKQVDLDKLFYRKIVISPAKNSGYGRDYIVLDLGRFKPEMTNFTASLIHEIGHWLVDPGFATTGLIGD